MARVNITQKRILIIIGILIFLALALMIGKFAYSYLAANVGEDKITSGEITASGDTLIFSKGADLSLKANTDNFNTSSGNLSASTEPSVKLIASSESNNATAYYAAGIIIRKNDYQYTTEDKKPELILTVQDENGDIVSSCADGKLKYIDNSAVEGGVSGFDITEVTGNINIDPQHQISTTSSDQGTVHTWTFTLTFINYETDQSLNETADLQMDVVLQKDEIHRPLTDSCQSGENLANCIKDNYTFEDILYHGPDGAEDGTNITVVNNTFGAADNSYRYYGANPNNYVCFGSSDEECNTDNLYRIIGVFPKAAGEYQVKLIKYDYATSGLLGTNGDYYATAVTPNATYYRGHLTSGTAYKWYTTSSNTWKSTNLYKTNLTVNFMTNIGEEWSSKIDATSSWNVGGMNITSASNLIYAAELSATGTGKNVKADNSPVGLMYVSEYAYAGTPSSWKTNVNSLTSYRQNNWLYMGAAEWTISRSTANTTNAYVVAVNGNVSTVAVTAAGYMVRPTFSLVSGAQYSSGSGTMSDPIRIS